VITACTAQYGIFWKFFCLNALCFCAEPTQVPSLQALAAHKNLHILHKNHRSVVQWR
jgi:hypothetical protein